MSALHTGHRALASRKSTPASASAKHCRARAIWNFMKARQRSSMRPDERLNMPESTSASEIPN
eukprot:216724-Chlamydomonas_euryale.AAC.5